MGIYVPRLKLPLREACYATAVEIYYFSGTGNSLHVAQELQSRISGTKLIPIVSLLHNDSIAASGETVGFVFPVYLTTLDLYAIAVHGAKWWVYLGNC